MNCFQILNEQVTILNNPGRGCGYTALIIVNDTVALAVPGYSMAPSGQLIRHWSEAPEDCKIFFRGQPMEEVVAEDNRDSAYGRICAEDFGRS